MRGATIHLCVDNQTELHSLSGRPCGRREYVKQSLEEIGILWLKGCEILGKWTASHQNIPGNKQVDKLAKAGLTLRPCTRTQATLGWGRTRSKTLLIERCKTMNPTRPKLPCWGTIDLPRNAAKAITYLRCPLTKMDASLVQLAPDCSCNNKSIPASTYC